MNRKLQRTIPYLSVLVNTPKPRTQNKLLKSFPDYVLDDIAEVLYNLMLNNVRIGNKKQRESLTKHKHQLTFLYNNLKKKQKRRKILRNQKGGFLAAVLPAVASVLPSAFLEI